MDYPPPALRAALVHLQIDPRFDVGFEPSPSTPAEFGTFIIGETAKLKKVIEFAGMSAE